MKVTIDIPTKLLYRMLRSQAATFRQDFEVEETALDAVETGVRTWEEAAKR